MNNLGTVLSELKNYEEAIKNIDGALKIFRKNLPPEDQNIERTSRNLNAVQEKLKRSRG